MKLSIVALVIILLMACNTGNNKTDEGDKYVVNSPSADLPDINKLITGEQIEEILGLGAGGMYDTDGSENERSRSMFFRLDDERPNGAILLRVSKNPMPEEFPNWDINFIDGALESGEKTLDPNMPSIDYEPLDLGLQGIGNRMVGKYFWRDEHRHVYMLAFNITRTPDEIHEAALKIGKIVDDNY